MFVNVCITNMCINGLILVILRKGKSVLKFLFRILG